MRSIFILFIVITLISCTVFKVVLPPGPEYLRITYNINSELISTNDNKLSLKVSARVLGNKNLIKNIDFPALWLDNYGGSDYFGGINEFPSYVDVKSVPISQKFFANNNSYDAYESKRISFEDREYVLQLQPQSPYTIIEPKRIFNKQFNFSKSEIIIGYRKYEFPTDVTIKFTCPKELKWVYDMGQKKWKYSTIGKDRNEHEFFAKKFERKWTRKIWHLPSLLKQYFSTKVSLQIIDLSTAMPIEAEVFVKDISPQNKITASDIYKNVKISEIRTWINENSENLALRGDNNVTVTQKNKKIKIDIASAPESIDSIKIFVRSPQHYYFDGWLNLNKERKTNFTIKLPSLSNKISITGDSDNIPQLIKNK